MSLTIEQAAILAHETNRVYCTLIGDNSQPQWAFAPAWQVDSAIHGIQFHLDNPDAGDDASHNNWMREKEANGWTYGPEKDPTAKKHPCLVPFEQLPPEQQAKDALFRGVVNALRPFIDGNSNPLSEQE